MSQRLISSVLALILLTMFLCPMKGSLDNNHGALCQLQRKVKLATENQSPVPDFRIHASKILSSTPVHDIVSYCSSM